MSRKTAAIMIIAVLVLLGGGLAWYFWASAPAGPGERGSFFGDLPIIGGGSRGGTAPSGVPQPAGADDGRGLGEARNLIQVVAKDILAPALSSDGGSLRYIARENGHVFSSDLDGASEQKLVNVTVLETFDAIWTPKRERAAMFYHESGAVKKFLNGVASGTPSRIMPQETTSLDWSPDGLSLAYLLRRASDTALVIANADSQKPATVFSTPIPDFTIRWVSKNTILLISRPSGLAPSIVMRFDVTSRKATLIRSGAEGIVLAPIPDGSGFLFSQSSNGGRAETLSLYALKDGAASPINLVTIAEKCAFSKDSKKLYCGVPEGGLPSPMPDEWYKGAVSFSDRIVEIDLATNQMKTVMENAEAIDVVSPFAAPDGQYLFFQNKKDGTLWRLTLKE